MMRKPPKQRDRRVFLKLAGMAAFFYFFKTDLAVAKKIGSRFNTQESMPKMRNSDPSWTLDIKGTAVLAIDFLEDVLPMTPMAKDHGTVANTTKVLDAARKADILVIHVGIGFRSGYPEISPNNKMFNVFKKKGMFLAADKKNAFVPELKPVGEDIVVHRPRVNAFYGSDLRTILDSQDIDTLVICGVATNWAVEAAARYAADADYKVVVLEDCCASETVEEHEFSINHILSLIADIHSADEFVNALK
jgi:nicotinamidase-related amidase